jgi:FemAB-related protein (PEP-CTERM system-associated)
MNMTARLESEHLRGQGPAPAPEVAVAVEADRAAWDAFVSTNADAAGYHEWAWRDVLARSFGHRPLYLMARSGGRVAGVLPMIEIRSLLFGRFLTSLPFVNYGGVLADSSATARALTDRAAALAAERGCRHVELRHRGRKFADLPCRQHKVAMLLELSVGMWDRLDRKVRNQVRKAEKSGLVAERGGAELLDEFYGVFARNMRDLGTPVYARRFFDEILRAFPGRAHVTIVRLNGRPVAAGLSYQTGATVEVPWASSVRDFNSLCPNHLLYWRIIEAAVAEDSSTLDFGRSTQDEGTFKFKEQWGAVPVPLHWEYALLEGGSVPDQSPKNPKFQAAIAMWQRLPLWAANTAGPHIVRGIP